MVTTVSPPHGKLSDSVRYGRDSYTCKGLDSGEKQFGEKERAMLSSGGCENCLMDFLGFFLFLSLIMSISFRLRAEAMAMATAGLYMGSEQWGSVGGMRG